MSYLGRFSRGQVVTLTLRCVDAAGAPSLPDAAPLAEVWGESSLVDTFKVPVADRHGVTGYFALPVHLDGRFPETGFLAVVYHYQLSGVHFVKGDGFEVVPGGTVDGAGVGMFYAGGLAGADYVLVQTDRGSVLRKRNPRL
jgi:hypothetical protein